MPWTSLKRIRTLEALFLRGMGRLLRQVIIDKGAGVGFLAILLFTLHLDLMSIGADIKEMQNKTFAEVFSGSFLSHWLRVSSCRKPVIAAINGYAVCLGTIGH